MNDYRAKQHAIDQGGKIGHEYTLIKGFSYVLSPQTLHTCHGWPAQMKNNSELTREPYTRVSFDQDSVQTLESHEHVKAVEHDGEMKTQ